MEEEEGGGKGKSFRKNGQTSCKSHVKLQRHGRSWLVQGKARAEIRVRVQMPPYYNKQKRD